ncbi:hypothetical protein CBL_09748 [Carabus blaptoides fortunei]
MANDSHLVPHDRRFKVSSAWRSLVEYEIKLQQRVDSQPHPKPRWINGILIPRKFTLFSKFHEIFTFAIAEEFRKCVFQVQNMKHLISGGHLYSNTVKPRLNGLMP